MSTYRGLERVLIFLLVSMIYINLYNLHFYLLIYINLSVFFLCSASIRHAGIGAI